MSNFKFITKKIAEARADIIDENNYTVDSINGIIVEEQQIAQEEGGYCFTRWYFCSDYSNIDGSPCHNRFGNDYSWVFAGVRGLTNFEAAHLPNIFSYKTLREWERKNGIDLYNCDLEFSTWDYSDDYDEDDDEEEAPLYEMEIYITKMMKKNKFNKIKI